MQKYIIIVVIILIIILGGILLLRGSSNQAPSASPAPSASSAGPISVVSTFPANNSSDAGVFSDISIKFSRPLSITEQRSVVVTSNPEIVGGINWSSDKTTLTITPNRALQTGQLYSMVVNFSGGKHSFTFRTTNEAITSQADQIRAQAEADKNFADWQAGVEATYPWLNKLPLQTADYYAYFDIDQKKFLVEIYTASRTEELKAEIAAQLKALVGADFDKYPIEYTIK